MTTEKRSTNFSESSENVANIHIMAFNGYNLHRILSLITKSFFFSLKIKSNVIT